MSALHSRTENELPAVLQPGNLTEQSCLRVFAISFKASIALMFNALQSISMHSHKEKLSCSCSLECITLFENEHMQLHAVFLYMLIGARAEKYPLVVDATGF